MSRATVRLPGLAVPLFAGLLVAGCLQDIEKAEDGGTPLDAGPVFDAAAIDASEGGDASAPDAAGSDAGSENDGGGADAGETVDSGKSDAGEADAGAEDSGTPLEDAGTVDAGEDPDAGEPPYTPNEPCRPLVLDCLDSANPDVLEVPTELTPQDAFDTATAQQTIQIRGLDLGAGWWVPPYVTLRGCDGARIVGAIAFEGMGGTVEGFEVSGSIVANHTGSYVVRSNRFVASTSSDAGIRAESREAYVVARVTLLADGNSFADRAAGISASTRYDTEAHEVYLTVRNNLFAQVASPVSISESGMQAKIEALIEHNTFVGFDRAISLWATETPARTSGNLFVDGDLAVDSDCAFEATFSLVSGVAQSPPYSGTLINGAFARASSPGFVDAGARDFRLLPSSPAVDQVPASTQVPAVDYFGCPRPIALLGTQPLADIGAIEAQ